jgi:hypothetical protein
MTQHPNIVHQTTTPFLLISHFNSTTTGRANFCGEISTMAAYYYVLNCVGKYSKKKGTFVHKFSYNVNTKRNARWIDAVGL